jgi:hypothetical protein
VYFTPNGTEAELGADGSDTTFNASTPFTRRMWAGGKMTWESDVLLRVGDEVEETTELLSATPKKSRSAGEMVLVEVEKKFRGPKGLALTDRRSWVFRPEIDPDTVKETQNKFLEDAVRGPSFIRDLETKSEGMFPKGRHIHRQLNNLIKYVAEIGHGHTINSHPLTKPRSSYKGTLLVTSWSLQILSPDIQWAYDTLQPRLGQECRRPSG